MVDKIIDIYNRNVLEEIKQLKEEIMLSNNSRYMFLFAYYFNEYIDDEFNNKLISLNNQRYITFMFNHISNIDEDIYFDKLLTMDNKTIFYSLYNRKIKDVNFYLKAMNVFNKRELDKYVFLTLYLYFVLLDLFDEKLFPYLKQIDENINKDNYREILESLINKRKEEVIEYDYESMNKYDGHHGYIPDMIVLHISFDYGRIIKTFYNEESEVSSHFIISRNGDVFNPVKLDNSAWANGTSLNESSDIYYRFSKNKIIKERNYNCNYYSYSIENESYDGTLTDKQYDVLIKTILKIIDYIEKTYNVDFKIDNEHIIGHRDVNPIVRVMCPGDKFPMEKVINDVKKLYKKRG